MRLNSLLLIFMLVFSACSSLSKSSPEEIAACEKKCSDTANACLDQCKQQNQDFSCNLGCLEIHSPCVDRCSGAFPGTLP